MKDKIKILGTKWKIDTSHELVDDLGECDYSIRKIFTTSKLSADPTSGEVRDMKYLKRKVLRHEIFHALAAESGVGTSAINTELVIDWMASMYPEMRRIFKELNIES